ncbi:hypothetical protein HanRHA438_Chr13g0617561 [Helianthus annuus]|nr:hypothetical protein HanRHA438_Chr13g0617561 [Helianthus annuus]
MGGRKRIYPKICIKGCRKRIYPKICIKWGVENVYTQKFLYKNYILSTTERKVQGVGRPHYPSPMEM